MWHTCTKWFASAARTAGSGVPHLPRSVWPDWPRILLSNPLGRDVVTFPTVASFKGRIVTSPKHLSTSDELMRQFLGGAATDLSGLVLAFLFLLCLWPMSLFLSESQRSRQAAALADGNRLRLTSRAIRRHERQTRLRGGLGTTPA